MEIHTDFNQQIAKLIHTQNIYVSRLIKIYKEHGDGFTLGNRESLLKKIESEIETLEQLYKIDWNIMSEQKILCKENEIKKPLYKEYKMRVGYTLRQSTCKKLTELYIEAYKSGHRVTMSSIVDSAITLYYQSKGMKWLVLLP